MQLGVQTFFPPAPGFNNPSQEAQGPVSLALLVHISAHTGLAHITVLPVPLARQNLLHCVCTQHCLIHTQPHTDTHSHICIHIGRLC